MRLAHPIGKVRMLVRKATRAALVLAAVLGVMLLVASPAFAFDETSSTMPPSDAEHCEVCHSPWPDTGLPSDPYGVHAGYATTTSKCQSCHTVHQANPSGTALLPAGTITDDCNACHDGTGGQGVYGVIKARTGVAPVSAHRTETATVVPGGNAANGGNSTMTFVGLNGTLTCTDCHSPHGAGTVNAFQGDRVRTSVGTANYVSTKLLKQYPGDVTTAVTEYGSDWCLACHKGRSSAGPVHNHPAESVATVATPYVYRNIPILAGAGVTRLTVLGQMGFNNRGYLMPYPRTTGADGQTGHLPICQQCHADPRDPGALNNDGTAQAADYTVTTPTFGLPDGANPADNPRFQVFPHEATSTAMLIQQNDDLCLNCHPAGQLP
jgi:hypothetical protein